MEFFGSWLDGKSSLQVGTAASKFHVRLDRLCDGFGSVRAQLYDFSLFKKHRHPRRSTAGESTIYGDQLDPFAFDSITAPSSPKVSVWAVMYVQDHNSTLLRLSCFRLIHLYLLILRQLCLNA